MKFGTWTYDSSKVNLNFYRDIKRFDLNSYVKSNEWSILENYAKRNTEKYGRRALPCSRVTARRAVQTAARRSTWT